MSEPMKKRPTNHRIVVKDERGKIYVLPKSVATKYVQSNDSIDSDVFFADYEKKHTKPGMILRGIRVREGLTQEEFAELIQVSQTNLSKMELGRRSIGKEIAKRIAKVFDMNYQSLL